MVEKIQVVWEDKQNPINYKKRLRVFNNNIYVERCSWFWDNWDKEPFEEILKLIPQNIMNGFLLANGKIIITKNHKNRALNNAASGRVIHGSFTKKCNENKDNENKDNEKSLCPPKAGGKIEGFKMNGGKNIIIIFISEPHIKLSLAHEFGHAFDYLLGYISYTEEFKQIYEEEKEAYCEKYITSDDYCKITKEEDVLAMKDYMTSSPPEFFAEMFSNYLKRPEQTIAVFPKTTAYIEEKIRDYQVK